MADYLILDLKDGPVKIKLRPDVAPGHVERITALANHKVCAIRTASMRLSATGRPDARSRAGSVKPPV